MSPGARTALVTGGAGFIGSHLVEGLLADGWRVRVLDDLSSGSEENLAAVRPRIEWLGGDIRDAALAERAAAGADTVFHLAAIPSVPSSVADPEGTESVNVIGTLRMLEAARKAGARRLVLAASCAVYGDSPELPKREALAVAPGSPYALQKYAAERYCQLYTRLYGFETVALRYFNVYGPRQNPASEYAAVVPRFVTRCLAGRAPVIYGDGEQTRDFVYVGDVVRANLLAASRPQAAGEVVNVASGRSLSLNQLFAAIARATGFSGAPEHEPARPGDVRESVASLDRARSVLGFEPAVGVDEGLDRTVASFRGQAGRSDA